MINAESVFLCGDIHYNNVSILTPNEAHTQGFPGMMNELQLLIQNKNMKAIVNRKMISCVRFKRMKPSTHFKKVKRMVMSYGQASYAPAYIIPDNKFESYGIPYIFKFDYKDVEHIAWVADNWLYLSRDEMVVTIEL